MRRALNRALDALPRARVGAAARQAPAFRTCGVAGFYAALAAAMGGALLAGRDLLGMAALCVVCALSFFAYVYVRRWLTGRETLVLLQQVWTAEAFCAAWLAAVGQPVLPWLDVVSPALCFFLAAGRVGCLVAGCCHGRPSSVGVAYREGRAVEGFPRHLLGVRLFPVQALEAAGLAFIGVTGLAALPFAPAGHVFAWFLAGYAVLRFATEGLRGDVRPHWLGISVPRWMALAELAAAFWITRVPQPLAAEVAMAGLLLAALVAGLALRRRFDPLPALLAPAHAAEVRGAVRWLASAPAQARTPAARVTSAGATVAVSGAGEGRLHVSLSLPAGTRDLQALCRLAAAALPEMEADGARAGDGVLHVRAPVPSEDAPPPAAGEARAAALYGDVVRRMQREAEEAFEADVEPAPPPELPRRQTYFGRG